MPDIFSVPTDEEIKEESQREKVTAAPAATPAPSATTRPTLEDIHPPAKTQTPASPSSAGLQTTPPPPPVPTTKLVNPNVNTTVLSAATPPPPPPGPTLMPRAMPTPPAAAFGEPPLASAPSAPPPPPGSAGSPPPTIDNRLPNTSGGEEMMPLGEEAGRPRWFWPAIGGGGVVLLLVLLIILQMTGVIYIGFLNRLVGGIPHNANKALAVITDKIKQQGNYEYTANVVATFSSTIPDINADKSAANAAEATGTINGQVSPDTSYAGFDFSLGANYPVSTLTGTVITDKENAHLFIDTLSLLKANNSWRKLSQADFEKHALSLPVLDTDLFRLLANASNGTLKGKSNVGKENTAVLIYQYDLVPIAQTADGEITESRLTLWVDKKDGRIIVAQADTLVSTPAGVVLLEVQSNLSKHGESQVTPVPKDAQEVTGTVADFYADLGVTKGATNTTTPTSSTTTQTTATTTTTTTPTTTTPTTPTTSSAAAHDRQRTTDLESIKQALMSYYDTYGLYPTTQGGKSKSTDPSSVLASALVPNYLTTLPVDPSGGQFYYGYTSDGFSFTLTSVIEDSSSPGAISGGGYYYQELKSD